MRSVKPHQRAAVTPWRVLELDTLPSLLVIKRERRQRVSLTTALALGVACQCNSLVSL
jgi:hypothetical protein